MLDVSLEEAARRAVQFERRAASLQKLASSI
jgi:hypothetical protein